MILMTSIVIEFSQCEFSKVMHFHAIFMVLYVKVLNYSLLNSVENLLELSHLS